MKRRVAQQPEPNPYSPEELKKHPVSPARLASLIRTAENHGVMQALESLLDSGEKAIRERLAAKGKSDSPVDAVVARFRHNTINDAIRLQKFFDEPNPKHRMHMISAALFGAKIHWGKLNALRKMSNPSTMYIAESIALEWRLKYLGHQLRKDKNFTTESLTRQDYDPRLLYDMGFNF